MKKKPTTGKGPGTKTPTPKTSKIRRASATRGRAGEAARPKLGELERARREAEDVRRLLEAVLEALPVGVAITDAEGGSIRSNRAYDQIWGGPPPLTRSIRDYGSFKAWWADTGEAVEPEEWASARAVQKGEAVVGQVLEIQRFDGSRTFVINSASPVRDAGGTIVGSAIAIQDITDLRKVEQALRESESKYHSLFEKMISGFAFHRIVTDEEGVPVDYVFLEANPAFEQLTGLKRADITGKRVTQVLPGIERDPADWIGTYGRVALQGEDARFEQYAAPLKKWFSVSAFCPLRGYFVAIFEDITQRKELEGEMAHAASFPEMNPNPVFEVTTEGRVTYANRATMERFPDFLSAGTGHPLLSGWDSVLKELQARPPSLIREVAVGSTVYQQSIYYARTMGVVRYYCSDITERTRVSEEYRAILRATMDGFCIADSQARFIDVNDAYCQMLGFSREALLGMTVSDVEVEESPEETDEHIRRMIERGGDRFETRLRRKDGQVIDVEVSANALPGMGRLVSFVRDITARRRAEDDIRTLNADLARRNAALEEANRELETFAYSVSHDLKGPLRGIDGFSKILLEEHASRLSEEGKDYLGRIRASSHRLDILIEDLLKLSRIIRTDVVSRSVDLSAVAAETAAKLREGEPGRAVAFIIEEGITVNGDRNLLGIAMDNLLGNAWKFTAKVPSAVIEFGRVRGREKSTFFVRDNGVGFDTRYADKLFQPFQRLHTEKEFPGTGIGLATVKRIISRHGGTVWAEAGGGRGATFFFTLE